ncbi:MAG: hypothetical protein IT342_02330 [Candidatus Melainabacteria bacterium]|nr:hypothetical protein [Candidatus Melainabacteria bacterium]
MFRKLVLISLFGAGTWYAVTGSQAQEEFAKSTCKAVSQRKAHKQHLNSQSRLTPQECSKHVGECVSVIFLVDNTHACRKGHVYLNASKDYKKCFAAIISASSRQLFPSDIDTAYKGKKVAVTGILETYGGTPKIILDKPQQIQFAE